MYNQEARDMIRDFERSIGVNLDDPRQRDIRGNMESPRLNGDCPMDEQYGVFDHVAPLYPNEIEPATPPIELPESEEK